jgi:hypothetical protein
VAGQIRGLQVTQVGHCPEDLVHVRLCDQANPPRLGVEHGVPAGGLVQAVQQLRRMLTEKRSATAGSNCVPRCLRTIARAASTPRRRLGGGGDEEEGCTVDGGGGDDEDLPAAGPVRQPSAEQGCGD